MLIVDDHPAFLRQVRALLEEAHFEVVGEAVDGASALALAKRLDPDVVLLDVQLPDMDGVAVAEGIAAARLRAQVVLVSARSLSDLGARVADAPVCGFIAKSELSAPSLAATLAAS